MDSITFPLHKAVIRNDEQEVLRILKDKDKVNMDERDTRGIPALHYAIHMNNRPMVQLLLSHGADATRKSAGGWNTLQEAIAVYNRDIVRDLLVSVQMKVNNEYAKRLPALVEQVKKIPDFYMELKWDFRSWVPLVSRLCPSDTYRIYKKGASFRVDTTLVGFENMKWIRGDISFLFCGEKGGTVYILDHAKQTCEKAFSSQTHNKDYTLHPESITDGEIKRMMTSTLNRNNLKTENVVFTPAKTWLGYEKTEKIGDDEWKAKIYEFEGFLMETLTRKRVKKTNTLPPVSAETMREELLERCDLPAEEPCGLMFPYEEFSEKSKPYKGTAWITEEFPRTVQELLPIFETLAPTQKHFNKMNQFISLAMPTGGFPVKLDIPVYPTVHASVTFLTHREEDSDSSLFEIPSHYTILDIHSTPRGRRRAAENNKVRESGGGSGGVDEVEDVDENDLGAKLRGDYVQEEDGEE